MSTGEAEYEELGDVRILGLPAFPIYFFASTAQQQRKLKNLKPLFFIHLSGLSTNILYIYIYEIYVLGGLYGKDELGGIGGRDLFLFGKSA
jgi:hypothetical protein